MTLNLIDKKMIVRNTIELQPDHTFVYASENCSDLESYNISSPGTYGQLDSSLTKIKNQLNMNNNAHDVDFTKTFLINKDYPQESYEGLTSLEILNNIKFLNNFNEYDQETADRVLTTAGFSPDRSADFKFGVEVVKQKYLVDDVNYYKKNSIKNLYRYYQDNMQHRVINPQWGFTNYNCLNFFNIHAKESLGKTHKNCLAYPNITSGDYTTYPFFKDSKNLNISFYINQNNKNIKTCHLNPGCVLFIEGIIGIYVVKGSNVDESGLTNGFKLAICLGDSVTKSDSLVSLINDNISESNSIFYDQSQQMALCISEDNILNYNNWQNVSISLQRFNRTADDIVNIKSEIFVDGTKTNDFNVEISTQDPENSLKLSGNGFVLIGNKYKSSDKDELFKKFFSINDTADGDSIGPYVNKNIKFGTDLQDSFFVNEVADNNINYDLNNSLQSISEPNYCSPETSFALTAELHDIRIYNSLIRDLDYIICKNSIKDFAQDKLIFSVPVLYYDQEILKKSLINLHGITSSTNSSHEENLSNITLQNISLRGPVNHCFSNKCHGHEVNVENFVYEFKKKVSPNIIFNGDITSDAISAKLLNALSHTTSNLLVSLIDPRSDININTKKGRSIGQLYSKKMFNLKENSNQNEFLFYFENNFYYRNNFIMPCDNGIQSQNINNVKGYYSDTENPKAHNDSREVVNLDFIDLNSTFHDNVIYNSFQKIMEVSNRELFEFTQNLGEIKSLEERNDFFVNSDISFKENYDNYNNASLNNFYRDTFVLADIAGVEYSHLKYKNNANDEIEIIQAGRGKFLKDTSNQVGRKINSDFNNSIASHLPSISAKNLNQDGSIRLLYYKTELPIYNLNNDKSETFSKSLCISTQLFGRKLERDTIELFDSDLGGTLGSKKVKLKDNGKGNLYRADADTKHAVWNSVGNCLYKEGIITILHPSLENFAETGYQLKFKSSSKLNVLELNLPAYAGKSNKSYNDSYISDLRLNESAFNSDEDFVYITDINLHDKNLNIVAKAKIVKPYAKKSTDNVLFRLKMDF